jgi:SRSO17 transposase
LEEFKEVFKLKTRTVFDKAEKFIRGIYLSPYRNIERISEEIQEDYFSLQHFISDSQWDYRLLIDKISQKTNQIIPREKLVSLIIDETGMVKKRNHSVGVAKQYCGNVGKIENCQVAVLGCLASGDFSTLVDARLYLPESWTNNPNRCKNVGIPEPEQEFKTDQFIFKVGNL